MLATDQHAPRACCQRLLGVGTTVNTLPAQPDEQITGLHAARVDRHTPRAPRLRSPRDLATLADQVRPGGGGDPRRVPLDHVAAPAAGARCSRNASRATVASSNGTFLPAANS